ncbi:hypothetical protein C351_02308, partial [Cryptococcus neoformans c8]
TSRLLSTFSDIHHREVNSINIVGLHQTRLWAVTLALLPAFKIHHPSRSILKIRHH